MMIIGDVRTFKTWHRLLYTQPTMVYMCVWYLLMWYTSFYVFLSIFMLISMYTDYVMKYMDYVSAINWIIIITNLIVFSLFFVS
jgi:hypothetical protein